MLNIVFSPKIARILQPNQEKRSESDYSTKQQNHHPWPIIYKRYNKQIQQNIIKKKQNNESQNIYFINNLFTKAFSWTLCISLD